MSPLRVRFVHADPTLRSQDSFLVRLAAAATGRPVEVVHRLQDHCDIEFASVQYAPAVRLRQETARQVRRLLPRVSGGRDHRWAKSNPPPSGRARSHVWFTGENVRPPLGDWSGYLSFDLDPLGGRNVYCPLWWWNVGLVGNPQSPFLNPAPDIRTLMRARTPDTRRRGFAVAFINNPDPMRLHAIEALRQFGKVEVYGRAAGRPVVNKYDVASRFRFVLCFENDLYPGYVTEKPIEAWACGAVPIWRGDDSAEYLNPGAMLNAAKFPNLESMAEEAWRVFQNDDAWSALASQPLVTREPDLEPAMQLIANADSGS